MEKLRKVKKNGIELMEERLIDIPVNYTYMVDRRSGGEFEGRGFYLSGKYNWVIGLDSEGVTILVPLKKVKL